MWVAAPVATLWTAPGKLRAIDGPATASAADGRAWADALDTAARLDLQGRVGTQALYGEPVLVDETAGGWARVVLPRQPSSLDPRGYPGWLPQDQLTADAPPEAGRAVVVVRTAPIVPEPGGPAAGHLSLGTDVTVTSRVEGWCRLAGPDQGWVPSDALGASSHPEPTGPALVDTARLFLGLGYLWGGRCGFGVDCSGFVSLVHLRHGIVIPRDAHDQSVAGAPVPVGAARPGDLLFFGTDRRPEAIHHVGMALGAGRMVHAPRTGRSVEVVGLETPSYADELCVARRYC